MPTPWCYSFQISCTTVANQRPVLFCSTNQTLVPCCSTNQTPVPCCSTNQTPVVPVPCGSTNQKPEPCHSTKYIDASTMLLYQSATSKMSIYYSNHLPVWCRSTNQIPASNSLTNQMLHHNTLPFIYRLPIGCYSTMLLYQSEDIIICTEPIVSLRRTSFLWTFLSDPLQTLQPIRIFSIS